MYFLKLSYDTYDTDNTKSSSTLSMTVKLEMKSVTDGFDYFIKESDFSNIKLFFETFICSDDFKNTKIEAISCPYNNKISANCKIKIDDEQQQKQNSDKKFKCQVPDCKYKKDISIVYYNIFMVPNQIICIFIIFSMKVSEKVLK